MDYIKLSKTISYILRHRPDDYGLVLDSCGFVDNKIRAYYGHSLKQEIPHEIKIPPDILYHGTTQLASDRILKEGIFPMKRQFVHLSEDAKTAIMVGKRRDCNPIVLKIDSKKAYEDGIIFMLENNNVWLVKYIDRKYISKI